MQERWVEISADECAALLRENHLGRIALVSTGLPLILPVNYVMDDTEVVFRTSSGSKFDAAVRHAPVAFEIDGIDERHQTGWSVLLRGRLHHVTDPAEIARLEQLPLVPWVPGEHPYFVRVTPSGTSGRRITVPVLPSDYWG